MRFINSVLFAASALASFAAAQSSTLFFTNFPKSVIAGTAYSVEWKTDDTTTPITITLEQGPTGNLKDVTVLTSDAANGKFSWTPSKSLSVGGNYALKISQGNQFNYGGPIALSGGSPSSASAASTASASASSASASSLSVSAKSNSTLSTAAITSAKSSGSASASASASQTGAASSGSHTGGASKTTGSAATSTNDAQGAPTSTGGAATLGSSPMALIFGAAAMMAYLN